MSMRLSKPSLAAALADAERMVGLYHSMYSSVLFQNVAVTNWREIVYVEFVNLIH